MINQLTTQINHLATHPLDLIVIVGITILVVLIVHIWNNHSDRNPTDYDHIKHHG